MRSIILCIALSALIAVLIVVPHIFISNTTKEMSDILKATDSAVKKEDWNKATDVCKKAESKWERYSFWYEMITEHGEIDEIIRSLRQLKSFIAEHEQPEARALISELEFMINHLKETNNISAENIF